MHLARWNDDQSIPDDLPLMDRWLELQKGAKPLNGVTVLFIQHQLGNQVPQAMAMLTLGVAAKDLWWLDIPYTSHSTVRDRLVLRGLCGTNFFPGNYHTLEPYCPYQRERARAALRFLRDRARGKLLVLDDGSYFLEAMACEPDWPPHIAIVEQTTRGFIKIEENKELARCSQLVPIIDVARSQPKRVLEPPFIGHAVCKALGRKLGVGWRPAPDDRCLILGYGAIGREVARFCQDLGITPEHICVHDAVTTRVDEAVAHGFSRWERTAATRFSLVLGCSGRASFGVRDHEYLKDGALLCSASSGSVELSREAFVELADASDDDDIWIDRDERIGADVHRDLVFHFGDRTARFANAGFPLNFDGRVNCIPTHYIQQTPTMMVAAAVQAVRATQPGPQDLDPAFCTWVDREFRAVLGPEAHVLETPAR